MIIINISIKVKSYLGIIKKAALGVSTAKL